MVANARKGPHIVQRPNDALLRFQQLAKTLEREHPLVNPMQVYDIGLAKGFRASQVCSPRSRVNGKEPLAAPAIAQHNAQPLHDKASAPPHGRGERQNGGIVRFAQAHHHLGLVAVVLESVQQSAGGNSCTTSPFLGIYEEYFHAAKLV